MALQKGVANLCMLMVRQPNNPLGVIFLSKILVAQISTCFGGDVYEGQWKGDKANGEGVGLQPLQPFIFSPHPSLPSIEQRCVSPCRWVEAAHELPLGGRVRESLVSTSLLPNRRYVGQWRDDQKEGQAIEEWVCT